MSGRYAELHHGIRVERLDLKAHGSARMRELVADADLFLASQRPAALARLGLDARGLLASTAGGRLSTEHRGRDRAAGAISGHDLTYLARAGLLGAELPRTLVADVVGAERAFSTPCCCSASRRGRTRTSGCTMPSTR